MSSDKSNVWATAITLVLCGAVVVLPFDRARAQTDVLSAPVYDGTFAKANGSTTYLARGGERHRIPDWNTYLLLGGLPDLSNVVVVPETILNAVPEGEVAAAPAAALIDGTYVKGKAPQVYLLDNGRRRVVSGSIFLALGGSFDMHEVQTVDDAVLAAVPEDAPVAGPPPADGTFVKQLSGSTIYLMKEGKRLPISSPAVFLALGGDPDWHDVLLLDDSWLALIPVGDLIGPTPPADRSRDLN